MEKTSQDSQTKIDSSSAKAESNEAHGLGQTQTHVDAEASASDADSGSTSGTISFTAALPEPQFAMSGYTIAESAADSAPDTAAVSQGDEIELLSTSTLEPRIEANEDLLQSLDSIPETMAFKIGEAADMVGVKQYVLRYWESEFETLRPRKSKNGQRVYTRRDVETAMMIKKLLYSDRFSIEGARTALRQLKSSVKEEKNTKALVRSQETAATKLRGLVSEIQRIRLMFA